MDAALSVALAQSVLTGGKYVSLGGMMTLLYYEAETGKVFNMNAAWSIPQKETNPLTIQLTRYTVDSIRTYGRVDGRTVLVPGFMKGVGRAHARFGRLSLAKVFEHAISIADTGVIWDQTDQNAFLNWKNILLEYPETREVFTKADGSFYEVGDKFVQPQLAATLRAVVSEGIDYMYGGPWAQKFVRSVQEKGGKVTMADMTNYDVIWSEPAHINYRGYDVFAHGYPAWGGGRLLELLKIAEAAELSESGHYATSPESLFKMFVILKGNNKVWYDDYEEYDQSLSDDEAKKSWDKMASDAEEVKIPSSKYNGKHSAAVVATDRWGNMVALLHSVNTFNWGANGIFVDGVSIPDPATFQQQEIMRAGAGNRLPEGTNPGMVFLKGRPIIAFSCIGNHLRQQSFSSLVNALDFQLTPQQASDTATIGVYRNYGSYRNLRLGVKVGSIPKNVKKQARELGGLYQDDRTIKAWYWTALKRNWETGEVLGTSVAQKPSGE